MDQQNYYHGKYNIGYPSVYANTGSEYQATGYTDHSPAHLHHPTGLIYNSNGGSTGSNGSDLSNVSATNLSRSSSNSTNATSSVNEFSAVPHSRPYSYIPDSTGQNVSSTPSNTSDCSNITYGTSFASKPYDQTANLAHVPVIAVTSNSSHSRAYSNLNYGSFQNLDYSVHKSLNPNYSAGTHLVPTPPSSSSLSTQNRSTLNSSTAFSSNHPSEHMLQPPVKIRSNNIVEGKTTAKTSVIKPLNPYNATGSVPVTPAPAPINYAKFQSYPIYGNNNKTVSVSNLEKSLSTNHGMCSTNHKSSDVLYCPEPIPARYPNPGYPLNVSNAGASHTNSHYLSANSYSLGYGHHHLAPQQNSVSRNLLSSASYQTSLEENVTANYFNGLVVRPTPSTYKQNPLSYHQNAYGYGRSNIASNASGVSVNHSSNIHAALPKPQTQKPTDDTYNSLAFNFDSTYDSRRNYRQYAPMYGSSYIDSGGYEDLSQYSGFGSAGSVPSFYATKTPKGMYNYNPNLNVYNSSGTSHVHLSPQTTQSVTTTSSTSTIVQQPVPINPSSSQLISSKYDVTSLHAHPMLPSPLFNSNNNKDYCSSNQYQQGTYSSQILYSTLQNGNYQPSIKQNQITVLPTNAPEGHSLQNKVYKEKHPTSAEKYSVVDLEEQINSSKIPKVAGPATSNAKPAQRVSDLGPKMSIMNVQESQRQRKSDSSQATFR